MSLKITGSWFSEIYHDEHVAFSLETSEKLHEGQSEFQKIEVYKTKAFGNLMVIDGCIMLTQRDNFLYHEMMTHPVLFTHNQPEEVVIIGGGDCGTLKEVLKHRSIKRCRQIEIDEQVTRVAEKYFPELCTANQDPRAEFHFIDGIKWMKEAPANSVDVIIIDSTDPVGPAIGLFTEDFYRNCFKTLRENGIITLQSESPLYHMDIIKKIHKSLRAAGFNHMNTLPFPQVVYPSGWWSTTLASKSSKLTQFREHDASNKIFTTQYYNADIHKAAFALPEFMQRELV